MIEEFFSFQNDSVCILNLRGIIVSDITYLNRLILKTFKSNFDMMPFSILNSNHVNKALILFIFAMDYFP